MDKENRDYLSTLEVAKILGISSYTIAGWRCREFGPPCQKIGGQWRYERSLLNAWIDEQKEKKNGQNNGQSPRNVGDMQKHD
jgi:predicted DNA-binding transcriptional regulator AlpA